MIIKNANVAMVVFKELDISMKQRILTALIALVILVPLIIYGEWPFIVFTYVFAAIGLYELMRMYRSEQGILYGMVAFVFLLLLVYPATEFHLITLVLTRYDILLLFLVVLLGMTVFSKNRFTFNEAGFFFLATTYVGTAFHVLIETRLLGLNYLLFILFIIWATDSGAYFVGKSLGKRKLWPEISPNKTIGGALGGIVMALIVGTVFHLIYPFDLSWISVLLLTLLISIVGQLGDLVASAMKRHYGIKDFGRLFPGHGGILDRLDSLLFVLIVLYIIQFI